MIAFDDTTSDKVPPLPIEDTSHRGSRPETPAAKRRFSGVHSPISPRKPPRKPQVQPFSRWCERGSQPLVSVLSVVLLPILAFSVRSSHASLLSSVRLSKTSQLFWSALSLIPMLLTLVLARAFDRVADVSIKELVSPSPLNSYLHKIKELSSGAREREASGARSILSQDLSQLPGARRFGWQELQQWYLLMAYLAIIIGAGVDAGIFPLRSSQFWMVLGFGSCGFPVSAVLVRNLVLDVVARQQEGTFKYVRDFRKRVYFCLVGQVARRGPITPVATHEHATLFRAWLKAPFSPRGVGSVPVM